MALGIDGQAKNFVPETNDVIYHTALTQPGGSDTIFFTAPSEPGDYDYLTEANLAAEAGSRALEKVTGENRVRAELAKGRSAREVFDEYGIL